MIDTLKEGRVKHATTSGETTSGERSSVGDVYLRRMKYETPRLFLGFIISLIASSTMIVAAIHGDSDSHATGDALGFFGMAVGVCSFMLLISWIGGLAEIRKLEGRKP